MMFMTRRTAREWAMQFLFQMDFNPDDTEHALTLFWKDRVSDGKIKQFTEDLIHGVLANLETIDSLIQRYADHWDITRMGAVDRNIIRLALYEMLFRLDIPPIVSINEAVDIAKQFSSRESGKFVNGILDRAKKDLSRPDRKPDPSSETIGQ